MTLSDIFLGLSIAYEDGPAIREFVDELNTNAKCVRGIKAIEHALNAYHTKSSDGNKQIPVAPPVDLHAVISALQEHVNVGPTPEGPGLGANP